MFPRALICYEKKHILNVFTIRVTAPHFSISLRLRNHLMFRRCLHSDQQVHSFLLVYLVNRRLFLKASPQTFQLQSPALANLGALVTLVLSLLINASKKLESKVQQPPRSHCDLQTLCRELGRHDAWKNKAFTSVNEVIRKHKSSVTRFYMVGVQDASHVSEVKAACW